MLVCKKRYHLPRCRRRLLVRFAVDDLSVEELHGGRCGVLITLILEELDAAGAPPAAPSLRCELFVILEPLPVSTVV